MAIFGVGATFNGEDISENFINNDIVGIGWTVNDAPELHEYMRTIKIGDLAYLKSSNFGSDITIKAIGIITDNIILNGADNNLLEIGRNIRWLSVEEFVIPKPAEKNNVRSNAMYQEFHPLVINEIIARL